MLTNLDLSSNQLCGLDWRGQGTYDPSGIQALASALAGTAVLTNLSLASNHIGVEGAKALADALASGRAVLTELNLANNDLCGGKYVGGTYNASGIQALAAALSSGKALLTNLNLSSNNLAGETGYIKATEDEGNSKEVGATVMYQGREMTVSKGIDRDGELKLADYSGVHALAGALKFNAVLTKLDARANYLNDEAKQALRDAVKEREGFLVLV